MYIKDDSCDVYKGDQLFIFKQNTKQKRIFNMFKYFELKIMKC